MTGNGEARVRRPAWALLEVEIVKHIGSFAIEERGQTYRALTPTERGLLKDFATHAAYELAETIWGDAEAEIDALNLAAGRRALENSHDK